ncbi:SMI1/KNR4 family protein [Nocardia xishanensis]|uniref:SMI1/KNR4 family protein n=1 Tax=Nocardia xishanensis TaxID=238964 RepID=UPI000A05CD29|nr:SMI1/KNR4 family protein [Nocardia xishanensis]
MQADLTDRVRRAVEDGVRARSAYYASIGLDDLQTLGAPAGEQLIRRLETRIGQSLPPSYRAFLLLHNGWQMVDGVTDLLPVEDLLGGAKAERIEAWQRQADKSADPVAAGGVVIGWADANQTRILLDPSDATDDGDWRLVQHYKDEEGEYDSFIHWLEESVDEYQELVELGDMPLDEDE